MKHRQNKAVALISLMLSVAIFLQSVPLDAFALEPPDGTAQAENSPEAAINDAVGLDPEPAPIEAELPEKRTETEKHFRRADGTYFVAQYDMPVHFRDEEGAWTDYDNTLVEDGATRALAEDEQEFTVKKSD